MSFLEKLKARLQVFMTGRHGADQLSLALLILGIVLSLLSTLLGLNLLYILSLIAYGYALFRMLSRNLEKREAENAAFLSIWSRVSTETRQFFNRMKNIRKYKYFKCPQCHARLRLPRKAGEVTVTCGKCHHAFRQKA